MCTGKRPGALIAKVVVAMLGTISSLGLVRAEDQASQPPPTAPVTGLEEIRAIDAIKPIAPSIPAEIVAALQEGRFKEAADAIKPLAEKGDATDARAFFSYLKGIAERLSGDRQAARTTLENALKTYPDSSWAAKTRMELAAVELILGHAAVAEELAQAQAAHLLEPVRKDRLAAVYQSFAKQLLAPANSLTPPDPKGAYELLAQARELAKGPELRASLLFAMGRASQIAGNHQQAIANDRAYLAEHPQGSDRFEVRFHLGESQRKIGQLVQARLTWTDLAADIAKLAKPDRSVDAIRARSLAEIPSTFGIPHPADDRSLALGITAIRRFVAQYPAHSKAVRASYEIGASFRARGKGQEALDALTQFLKEDGFRLVTPEARRDFAELSMSASFEAGQILQGQGKFEQAVAAWRAYLTKYPNGPQSAEAQRGIITTALLVADDHLSRGNFPEARNAWSDFVAQNPLDGRVPEILFRVGESFVREEKFDQAIAAWENLIGRFPTTEPAGHAQFATASLFENQKGNLAEAIERFRKIEVAPWREQARERIAVMESKALTVVTPRAFRSGEVPHLKISSRNLEKLSFSAYKLDAEAYFRKKLALRDVESLDIGLVAPDAEWTLAVPGYARYKPVDSNYDLTRLGGPGVYVVKVTDEKTLQATTLVLVSDLEAIVKTSKDQLLVFAENPKTGKGRSGARVLVSDGERLILDAKTGEDGVLLHAWDRPRETNRPLSYLLLDDGHTAGSALDLNNRVAQGLSPRAFLYSDRPAYRPGQTAEVRGIIREVREGQYVHQPRDVYRFDLTDSRGRLLVARQVTLSDFGTFHERVQLDPSAPEGTYRMRVYQPGKSDFAGTLEVRSYQLEPIDLSFQLEKTVYYRGETVRVNLIAKYQYGAPLGNRPIEVSLPDGRILQGTTDPSGKYSVELPTIEFAEEQSLAFSARLPRDNVSANASVMLAVRGFNIGVKTQRDVYLDGESIPVQITATDAQGEPTGRSLSVALIKRVTQANRITEREVQRKSIKTDARTGTGALSLRVDDAQGGTYLIRVSGTDQFDNPIVTDRTLVISGKADATKLRILTETQRYRVGDQATVNLHNRAGKGTALLTWEADRILSYKLVSLADGENAVGWAVDGAQFPNFTLTAALMTGNTFSEARLDVQVERDLHVKVSPLKPIVGPNDAVELEIEATDQLGKPAVAELSIAIVDQSLLRLHGDHLPPIGPFFYNQTRTGSFSTNATNTFRYAPITAPTAQAVVEEAERAAAEMANAADRDAVRDQAKRQIAPAPIAPAAASPPMMGRASGGMGGAKGIPSEEYLGESELLKEKSQLTTESKSLAAKRPRGVRAALGVAKPEAQQQARERFVETAYWNPSVVTGPDGKAKLTIKAPAALSEYRISARGITGADTLVGEAVSTLTVRKNFFVDLKVPPSLTQGDKPRFLARVHHQGVSGEVSLKLTVYAGGREEVYPKEVVLKDDGVDEVLFEPFEVPDGDLVRLNLTGSAGKATDQVVAEIPIRPWGVQAIASASGTSSDGTTVFVGLPAGRSYENPAMQIVVSPSLHRMLIELALDSDGPVLRQDLRACILPPPMETTADRAAELIATASVLGYLKNPRAGAAPEAQRLTQKARALVSGLVSLQNEDGGWSWTGQGMRPSQNQDRGSSQPSHRLSSAAVVWALSASEPMGFLPDRGGLDRGIAWLSQEITKLQASDHDTRAAMLHALSAAKRATFEQANSLNRVRQSLSNVALGYLALTFANLDRPELANEILTLLVPRASTETVGPGKRPRLYWTGGSKIAAPRSSTEITALITLAFARVRPRLPELDQAVDWLLAHRNYRGWRPLSAQGAALAALAVYYERAEGAEDRYKLVVTVNETEVATINGDGATSGQTIAVPRKAIQPGQKNRIRFELEGRGTFGYAVTLGGFTQEFGPDQDRKGKTAWLERRVYEPSAPELDGRVLPVGFSSVVNPQYFQNIASQVTPGGKVRVSINAHRNIPWSTPEWERDFLIVQEYLPAGASLVDGSVKTTASSFSLADGVLSFAFPPSQEPGLISYEIFGMLPGQYRALPASVRSAYEPGAFHLGTTGRLTILPPGSPNTDPYKATPDELLARGKIHFDAGRYAAAGESLTSLFSDYTLRDDILKDAARMLLLINIRNFDARKVVQYFEVVKEKAPELFLDFDQLQTIGKAYRDIGEYERAMIVWRGLVEASYLEDARIGEVLRQRGKVLESLSYLASLWRAYPSTPSIESDLLGLSQVVSQVAEKAISDPAIRRELAAAGVTRSQLLLQSIRLLRVFASIAPRHPLADEASLALLGAFLDLEDYASVVELATRFAKVFPSSSYQESFQYSEALGNFHRGRYDRAIEVASKISSATFKDANGVEVPSPNKWQAIYILGQIHDARRQPTKALNYYRQVADRFSDAAGAIAFFSRKELKVPEVMVVRPQSQVEAGQVPGLQPATRTATTRPGGGGPAITLSYRNVAKADVKVYPVDLMQLYLTRRTLDGIARIDLAGISPLHESTVSLNDAADLEEHTRSIPLPLAKEGAYLIMIRGEELDTSGIVLVSPLEMEVLEPSTEADSDASNAPGARIVLRNAVTKEPLSKVQVKVIGSVMTQFISGETDLRGVFVAEGVLGTITAVARKDSARYAFYRGTAASGPNAIIPTQPPGVRGRPSEAIQNQALDANLRTQNMTNSARQTERLQRRYQQPASDKARGAAAGEFR